MKPIIIYGAGLDGEMAYRTIMSFGHHDILFFVDRDSHKIGKKIMGHDVLSTEMLKCYTDKSVRIIIASRLTYAEMYNYAKDCGFNDITAFGDMDWLRRSQGEKLYKELNMHRCIKLGRFLKESIGDDILLHKMPNIYGGSSQLDYAFLLAVAKHFGVKTYLEVGTYIGASIYNMSLICDMCYGISASPDSSYSMGLFCKTNNLPDYSDWLTHEKKIHMLYCKDSKDFDFGSIKENIDMYFIDADHSYTGVYVDTQNIFADKSENSIVVWHDFQQNRQYDDVVIAVKDALGDEFNNVYITDNNYCGIYIPPRFQKGLPLTKKEYIKDPSELYYYDTTLHIGVMEK